VLPTTMWPDHQMEANSGTTNRAAHRDFGTSNGRSHDEGMQFTAACEEPKRRTDVGGGSKCSRGEKDFN